MLHADHGESGALGGVEHPLDPLQAVVQAGVADAQRQAGILVLYVDEDQRLLESTDLAVEQVASTCGFGSAVTMRQAFARILSTTPSAYRRRFRTVSPDPAEA